MTVVAQQSNQVGQPLEVDDKLVLAQRKRERDAGKELDRIRDEIKYTALHGQAVCPPPGTSRTHARGKE